MVCGWVFIGTAMLVIFLLLWSRRLSNVPLGKDDYLTFVAFTIAIALVAHTSWAIVDEGLGRQAIGTPESRRAALIKESSKPYAIEVPLTNWVVVNHGR